MGRCKICGQVNGHVEGCPNEGIKNAGEIRCLCGTMNPVGAKKCRECGTSLEGTNVGGRGSSLHQMHISAFDGGSEARQLTKREYDYEENTDCPFCGYKLRPDSKFCPQCRKNIDGNNRNSTPQLKSEPIWNMNNSGFKIGLCDKNGNIGEAKTYTDDDIMLGRDELAPEDNHVSKKHIHLTNEGGQWYVEDVSSTHQTYLIVKKKMPINNGDVLVLGNKFFRFVTE